MNALKCGCYSSSTRATPSHLTFLFVENSVVLAFYKWLHVAKAKTWALSIVLASIIFFLSLYEVLHVPIQGCNWVGHLPLLDEPSPLPHPEIYMYVVSMNNTYAPLRSKLIPFVVFLPPIRNSKCTTAVSCSHFRWIPASLFCHDWYSILRTGSPPSVKHFHPKLSYFKVTRPSNASILRSHTASFHLVVLQTALFVRSECSCCSVGGLSDRVPNCCSAKKTNLIVGVKSFLVELPQPRMYACTNAKSLEV